MKIHRKKKEEQSESNPITSLRPSPHACVNIPNTYGGNIIYGPAKDLRSTAKHLPDSQIPNGHAKSLTNNNNTTLPNIQEEVGNSGSLSVHSSLYEMPVQHGGSRPAPVPDGSGTFVPDETAQMTPDYYVERTGYSAGTTGFLQDLVEFPEVHFVEVDSPRNSGLEPIAEESQLHLSDIIVDPTAAAAAAAAPGETGSTGEHLEQIRIMDDDPVLLELQNLPPGSRGSAGSAGGSSSGGSSHASAGLATIPEEDREDGDGMEGDSLRSSPPSTAPRPGTRASNAPYSRTSLEGTRIPRATLKQIEKSKVQYPLFKNDETGNLENYLEDRRGSY